MARIARKTRNQTPVVQPESESDSGSEYNQSDDSTDQEIEADTTLHSNASQELDEIVETESVDILTAANAPMATKKAAAVPALAQFVGTSSTAHEKASDGELDLP
jgi:hypothetical protein